MKPIVNLCLATAVVAQAPDLIVANIDRSGLTGDWQRLAVTGTLTASISNLGDAATNGPFVVLFFEDADGNGAWSPPNDREYGRVTVSGLPARGKQRVSIPLATNVRFRDDLIWVVADVGNAVPESDESNNLLDTGRGCLAAPPGSIEPVLEWSWTSTTNLPDWLNVMNTPAVIDLTGDGVPEIVFGSTASRGGANVEVGVLRALDGRTGAEVFTVTDPTLRVNTAASIAVGDIDGDRRPEIIACDDTGARLIAFEHDGTFKWRSPQLEAIWWGAPAIADLDQDGNPEIVVGRQALRADGSLWWTGTGGRGANSAGPLSGVADLDNDGSPDVVAGNTLYAANGTIKWVNSAVPDGLIGTANFDADNRGEIVLVNNGAVYLLDDDGSLIRQVALPGGGTGGPPTIADYDNDGQPEIGVAGATRYTVFEGNLDVRWSNTIQDSSSNRTGSSVFDFDGDGSAEVVYRDELFLRIYRGTDGTVLWSVPMSSCTWHEYVLVADADADGNAEIIAVANDNCGFGPQRGVFVYGDLRDSWVSTRQIWNQHTYHITNVGDDGSIPRVEPSNWLTPPSRPFNSYRQNTLAARDPRSAPDLTASRLRLPCIGSNEIVARVGNGGAVQVGIGVAVSLYDGDPRTARRLATVATTRILRPGEFEDVRWPVPANETLTGPVFASVDDTGGLVGRERECDETNNLHSLAVCATAARWVRYGQGWPGRNGVPDLAMDAVPALGTTASLVADNNSGRPTIACVIYGLQRAQIATPYGGTLLIDPFYEVGVVLVPGTNRFPLIFPCMHELCGESYKAQVVFFDDGASQGIAFTPGIDATVGR